MLKLMGKSVYKGIVLGTVTVFSKRDMLVNRMQIQNTETEFKRVEDAIELAKEQLQKLYDKALKEVGKVNAAIFEVHQMMLEDEDYLDAIYNMIRTEMVNAE